MKTVVVLLTIISSLWAGELVIINGNKGNLTKQEVQKIYLGKQKRWDDGTKIHLTTYNGGELADSFMKHYLGKKHSQFLIYWKQLMFTGRGIMPKQVETQEEMIEYVKKTPGAIGYISDANIDGISVIRVDLE